MTVVSKFWNIVTTISLERWPRYFVTAMLSSSVSRNRVEAVPRNFVTEMSSGF